jgi:hypothetical protein
MIDRIAAAIVSTAATTPKARYSSRRSWTGSRASSAVFAAIELPQRGKANRRIGSAIVSSITA